MRDVYSNIESKISDTEFKNEITKKTCLMIEESSTEITFLHRSIMEYYAASFIKTADEALAKEFYESVNINFLKWEQTINFLREIDKPRFASFYAISVLEKHISSLRLAIKEKNTEIKSKLIHENFKNSFISISHSDNFKSYSITTTVGDSSSTFYNRALDDIFILNIFRVFPTDDEELHVFLKRLIDIHTLDQINERENEKYNFDIPLVYLLSICDIKPINRGLVQCVVYLKRELQELKQAVDTEAKKLFTFSKIIKSI
jgi:hypothetical protein